MFRVPSQLIEHKTLTTVAQAALRKPATRLAADFTFPVIDKKPLPILESSIKSKEVDFSSINVNKYDSLK